jgi:hypothetical protein
MIDSSSIGFPVPLLKKILKIVSDASDLCHDLDGDHLKHGLSSPEICIQSGKERLPNEEI